MPKRVDLNSVPVVVGSGYPAPYDKPCAARARQRLGETSGLTDFGVNLMRLPPGTWSSQRHWHAAEDEFVFVVDGDHRVQARDIRTGLQSPNSVEVTAGLNAGDRVIIGNLSSYRAGQLVDPKPARTALAELKEGEQ